jgi:hypothetical protein
MRVMFLIVILSVMVCEPPAAQAYYGQGPWCAVQSLGFGTVTEDCSMRSFEQCRMETIAGNRGFCTPNPRWHGAYVEPPRRYRKHRVRHR